MTEEDLYRAEEMASARAEAEAYKMTERVAPGYQKKTFDVFLHLVRLGIRLMREEIDNIQ